jgi:hypothetical protein
MTMTTRRRVGTTADLPLTEQERTELRIALRTHLSDLRTEISHEDRYKFREELKVVGRYWRKCSGGWTVGATTTARQI